MSLFNCPECSANISDKAKTCPHCGFPVAQKNLRDHIESRKQFAKNLYHDCTEPGGKYQRLTTVIVGLLVFFAVMLGLTFFRMLKYW